MAENSLIGAVIVGVIGLLAMLWLSSQILGVWRGNQSAPWLPIRTTDYVLGQKAFEITDRNFPVYGIALFCMGGFAFCLGGSAVAGRFGFPELHHTLKTGSLLMLVTSFLFGFIALFMYWINRLKSLTSSTEHENVLRKKGEKRTTGNSTSESDDTRRSSTSQAPPTSSETATENESLLDPDGLLDNSLTVIIGIVGGFIIGFIELLVITGLLPFNVGFVVTILIWLGATAYLVRRRTVQEGISKTAYGIAIAIMSVSLIVFTPIWDPVLADNRIADLFIVAIMCSIPAAIVGGIGLFAGRFVPESGSEG